MHLLLPVVLTLWARGHITERIPWEILESICEHSEEVFEDEEIIKEGSDRYFGSYPVPEPEYEASLTTFNLASDYYAWPDTPRTKHQKNLFILSMSHVCQSWRLRLVGLKRLWREIAFSTEAKSTGIRLATFFLARVTDDDIPLHIYAGLPFGHLNPPIGALLSKLREKTDRWEKFFYWGRLGPYSSYLDLPAPRLRHFSGHNDISHIILGQTTQFFAGHAPTLQSLVTSALGNWQPASLTNLRTLDLWDCAPELSIKSLLSALRSTPQLEKVNLVSPNPPVLDCPPDEVVNLPHLKNLNIRNPDFYTIVGHFIIPNARTVELYSSSNRGADGLKAGRPFQTTHPFVGFAAMANPPPMFGRPIMFLCLEVQPTESGLRFTVTTVAEGGPSLCVGLEWTGGFGVHRRSDYIRNSMSALAKMPFLPPSFAYIVAPPRLIDYSNPLFLLDTIGCLIFGDGRPTTILRILSSRSGRSPLLPRLLYLIFPEEELDRKTIKKIPGFLRFRKDLIIVLSITNRNYTQALSRVCIVEGEFVSLEMIPLLASLKPPFTERTAAVPTRGVCTMIYIRLKGESS
jgi:hypothetical protein